MYRVYAAGKIEKNDWRGTRMNGGDEVETDFDREVPYRGIIYVGPYFQGCDHGCTHLPRAHAATYECSSGDLRGNLEGTNSEFHRVQEQVFLNSLRGIERCDVFFARLDHKEAFGTFLEIGHAGALGKPILLDLVPGALSREDQAEMWFALRSSILSPISNAVIDCIPWWSRHPGSKEDYIQDLKSVMDTPQPGFAVLDAIEAAEREAEEREAAEHEAASDSDALDSRAVGGTFGFGE